MMTYSDFYVRGATELELMGILWLNYYIFRTDNGFVAIDKKSYVKNSTRIVYVGYTPSSFFDAIQMDPSVIPYSFQVVSE